MNINKKLWHYYFGLIAEIIAVLCLRCKFYQIIATRFKSPFGEIDIIAKKNNQIIFIEVKARKDISLMDFISKHQQQRIIKSSQYFLLKSSKYQKYLMRFDAIIVNKFFWQKHLKNYW